MHRGFYPLHRAHEQLVEDLGVAKVVREPCGEEEDVGGDDAVEPYSDGLHVGDHDVEDDGEVLEGEDEHLVGQAAVPDEGVWNPLLFVVLRASHQLPQPHTPRKDGTHLMPLHSATRCPPSQSQHMQVNLEVPRALHRHLHPLLHLPLPRRLLDHIRHFSPPRPTRARRTHQAHARTGPFVLPLPLLPFLCEIPLQDRFLGALEDFAHRRAFSTAFDEIARGEAFVGGEGGRGAVVEEVGGDGDVVVLDGPV